MSALPVDIWLIVFDVIDDLDSLWSTVRNVCHQFRRYVDQYFCYGIVQNTLISLHYSTINRHSGPTFQHVRVPLAFASISEDTLRVTFRQVQFKEQARDDVVGSVRGWVPFIEWHCREALQPKPKVLHKGKRPKEPPIWEKEYERMVNTLPGHEQKAYFIALRDHTSIGRGDRPPYYLRVANYVHDTALVDLVIDCASREISFDWRRTFSALFMEQHYIVRTGSKNPHINQHDEDLNLFTLRLRENRYGTDNLSKRVRRKRLRTWMVKNKDRMTHEHRMLTEDRIEHEKDFIRQDLHNDNLQELKSEAMNGEEFVPAACSEDHPELMLWPWRQAPSPRRRSGSIRCCVVL